MGGSRISAACSAVTLHPALALVPPMNQPRETPDSGSLTRNQTKAPEYHRSAPIAIAVEDSQLDPPFGFQRILLNLITSHQMISGPVTIPTSKITTAGKRLTPAFRPLVYDVACWETHRVIRQKSQDEIDLAQTNLGPIASRVPRATIFTAT